MTLVQPATTILPPRIIPFPTFGTFMMLQLLIIPKTLTLVQHHNRLISETSVSTVSIYDILYYSNSQIDQKLHSINKRSVLPLFLAFYRTIYYLLNGNFNQAYDVNHLINRLLLTLQRYITRCNDFKYLWFMLLLSGLLRTHHISLWFLTVLFLKIHNVEHKLFWFQKIIYTVNLLRVYTMNLTIKKTAVLSSCLHSICFKNFTLLNSLSLPVSDQMNLTTNFIGGGRSARIDYGLLKPYVVSMEIQLKNPDQFNYVYGSHQKN